MSRFIVIITINFFFHKKFEILLRNIAKLFNTLTLQNESKQRKGLKSCSSKQTLLILFFLINIKKNKKKFVDKYIKKQQAKFPFK